jgi:LmbE family N-acetylglucosaminyl deacetylase
MHVIVFSPHQDDEAFSSAGTIARHVNDGDHVTIVFTTDGRLGTNPMIEGQYTPEELARERAGEAINAAREMDVDEQDVIFLGYHDQELASNHDDAIARLKDLIEQVQPCIVYLAITNYGHVDHLATFFFVFESIEAAGYQGEIRVSKPAGLAMPARPPDVKREPRMARVETRFPVVDEITVDITSTITQKIASIMAHHTQLGMFYNMVDPADDFDAMIEEMLAETYRDKMEVFERRQIL